MPADLSNTKQTGNATAAVLETSAPRSDTADPTRRDDKITGIRLILVWTAAVTVSWLIVILALRGLYELTAALVANFPS